MFISDHWLFWRRTMACEELAPNIVLSCGGYFAEPETWVYAPSVPQPHRNTKTSVSCQLSLAPAPLRSWRCGLSMNTPRLWFPLQGQWELAHVPYCKWWNYRSSISMLRVDHEESAHQEYYQVYLRTLKWTPIDQYLALPTIMLFREGRR